MLRNLPTNEWWCNEPFARWLDPPSRILRWKEACQMLHHEDVAKMEDAHSRLLKAKAKAKEEKEVLLRLRCKPEPYRLVEIETAMFIYTCDVLTGIIAVHARPALDDLRLW